jgi:NAD(P)-dependent dehydrogenase (short-subunit alcohol dehydrogenase family)
MGVLEDKALVVTGAAHGLGRAYALRSGDWDDPQSVARLDSMVRAHLQPVGFWPERAD